MKLSKIVEGIENEIHSKGSELAIDGIYHNDTRWSLPSETIKRSLTRKTIKSIKEKSILKLGRNGNYFIFIVKPENEIDKNIIEDLYNKIGDEDNNFDFDEYYDRTCNVINVILYRLVERNVF